MSPAAEQVTPSVQKNKGNHKKFENFKLVILNYAASEKIELAELPPAPVTLARNSEVKTFL